MYTDFSKLFNESQKKNFLEVVIHFVKCFGEIGIYDINLTVGKSLQHILAHSYFDVELFT